VPSGPSRSAGRGRSSGGSPSSSCTDLERDGDGLARVELLDPEGGTGVALWADASFGYLMAFSGDPLPDVARRSLAVEPMTCPPNAFQSGRSLICLEPGRSFTSTWGIEPWPGG
jgi:aldose 1-epimerase